MGTIYYTWNKSGKLFAVEKKISPIHSLILLVVRTIKRKTTTLDDMAARAENNLVAGRSIRASLKHCNLLLQSMLYTVPGS